MAFSALFQTGFEHQNALFSSIWGAVGGGGGYISTAKYHTGAAGIVVVYGYGRWLLPVAQSELYFGTWMWANTNGGGQQIKFGEIDDASSYIHLRIYNHAVDVYVQGVLKASGTVYIPDNSWFHVQCHIIVSDSGTIETVIEGIPDITYNGDTAIGANTEIHVIELDCDATPIYFDDICWGTGGWPGDRRYELLKPVADTATAEWTESTGTDHWELVNEVPYSETDYVYTGTNDLDDLYEMENWTGTGKVPISVIEWVAVKKDLADTSTIKLLANEGVNTLESAGLFINTSTQWTFHEFTTAPDGTAWDDTHIDNLNLGIKSVI